MTKYDEVMEKLEVTPEMHARILQNVETQMAEPCKKPNRLRRFAALAACLAVLLVGAMALPKFISSPVPEESETMIANGMVEVISKEELSEAVGFPVKSAQSLPFFPQSIYYTSYWGEMAQIDYANGGSMACFRQSLGEEDNSGDWSEYPAQKSLTVNGCAVTLKGEADSYTLAIWQDGTYSYSLSLSAGQPASVWESIVEGVA
ncbi:hypothetical protein [Oscillospiraceae bacterium]|nr:hypothetical protein [Oscillospiraceae bacterium]